MRRFELGDRRWAIGVDNTLVKLAWGDKGKPEQRVDRKLATADAAFAYRDMQIAKQLELGYVEVVPEPDPANEQPVDERPIARTIRFEIASENPTFKRQPRPARFLELEQRDRVLIERSGELAHPDTSAHRETSFATIAEASEAYEEEVQTLREDNWRQIRSSTVKSVSRSPDLEQQCWASPDDPAPWSVYADWLLEHGDPLGEVASNDDATARVMFDDHLRELGTEPEHVTIERRHGFPRRATIKIAEVDGADPIGLADAARSVRTCSAGRFIDVLRFGLAGYTNHNDWAPTLRALAAAPHPERIRELYFDDYESTDCEISWATMGDLTDLFAPFTNLEVLHLKSGAGGTLGELDLPKLRRLIRESGGLGAAEIDSILNATWPRLEHLELWFGDPNYGGESTVAALHRVFDRARFPRLRHLGIVNCTWVEDAIDALAASRLLPELHSLDLSKGILARRGALLLREHAARFRHLASIDLSANLLLPPEADAIREVLDNVVVVGQREREFDDYEEAEADGETARYVAVGE